MTTSTSTSVVLEQAPPDYFGNRIKRFDIVIVMKRDQRARVLREPRDCTINCSTYSGKCSSAHRQALVQLITKDGRDSLKQPFRVDPPQLIVVDSRE